MILVSGDGAVETHAVPWTVNEFNALRAAAACNYEMAVEKHRCGAPFTDLQEVLARGPRKRAPDRLRAFLRPFAVRRANER